MTQALIASFRLDKRLKEAYAFGDMAKKPRKPEHEKKETHFTVWVTRDQENKITRAAQAEDEDKPSVWIRKMALRAARAVLGEKE